MGAPNIQQQLYLKTALNESKDGMFDHPADLDEATKGSHKNVMRLDKAFRKSFDKNPKSAETERLAGAASLADKKLDAKELRRGGASERTMRRRINQDKWSEGWGAKNRFAREGQKKRRAALKAKGIAEALEEKLDEATKGSHKNVMRLDTAFLKSFNKNPRSAKTDELAAATELANKKLDAKELRRGGASERTMRRRINQDKWSEGWGAKNRFEREGQKKRRAALKAKGIAEALEEKLDEGYQAKRKRIIRKYGSKQLGSGSLLSPKLDDFMRRSFKKKRQREERISGGKGSAKAMEISARKKTAAMKEKGLMEGSRGTQKLKRIMKSVTKNYRQGKAMIGTRNKDVAMRELVSPESPTAKATRAALNAGVDHMQKKAALRRQISSRTRAAAMRERGRAGLSPKLPKGSGMMPKNETGGYEYTENPKRVPSAVKTYRNKRNMYR